MDSHIKLRFGKYKGTMIKDVPDSYLKWCIAERLLKGRAMLYTKRKVNYPKDRYKVRVEDAVTGDGVYFVDAYSKDDAIMQCRKENHIQITQSYSGTTFYATMLNENPNNAI